jgi:hypothetical protein
MVILPVIDAPFDAMAIVLVIQQQKLRVTCLPPQLGLKS